MARRFFYVCAGMLGLALVIMLPHPASAAWPTDPLVNVPVCTAPDEQYFPVIVSDGAGGAIVAWTDRRAGFPSIGIWDIYAQHVLASGVVDPAWPVDGRALCTADNGQQMPAIVTDGAGGAIVAWIDPRNGIDYDIYAQHVLASGTVDPSWPVDGRALCMASHDQYYPTIAADGAGGAIVTWQDNRAGLGLGEDIYAQHVLASGVVDPAWPTDGRALCTAANHQYFPMIVADAAGGAIVTWYDDRSSAGFDVYAQHVLASGAVDPAWPTDGRALCTAAHDQLTPVIAADGVGGAIVAWYDARGPDIYAQHVLVSGGVDPAWPADGAPLCTAPDLQAGPTIVTDGAGGAIVAWVDFRSGSHYDIYAQHVLSSGAVDATWTADGSALSTVFGDKQSPTIVTDGAGGAIVTWTDSRSPGYFDIYAQHVRSSGDVDPAWPADGSALCTAANYQDKPTITTDGSGGAIVTWLDNRTGSIDIYAQNVRSNGQVGDVVPACLEVAFDLKPHHFNLNSNGKWVTGYVRPPAPYLASQIDVGSIRLNQVVAAHDAKVEDHDRKLKVKFLRDDLKPTLTPGDRVPVTVTGMIAGGCFTGINSIKVKAPKIHTPGHDLLVVAGTATEVTWDADPTVASASLLSSVDDGVTWKVEVQALPNTGSYLWQVPGDLVGTVRLAIVTIYTTDETGIVSDSEFAISDPFRVVAVTGVERGNAEFAVGPTRNPVTGPFDVNFSLANPEPATLTVFDVSGRMIMSRDVGSMGAGRHTLRLGIMPVGMYVVRLSQAGRSLSLRVAVLH